MATAQEVVRRGATGLWPHKGVLDVLDTLLYRAQEGPGFVTSRQLDAVWHAWHKGIRDPVVLELAIRTAGLSGEQAEAWLQAHVARAAQGRRTHLELSYMTLAHLGLWPEAEQCLL